MPSARHLSQTLERINSPLARRLNYTYLLLTISFALAVIGVVSSAREKNVPISRFGWSVIVLAGLSFLFAVYKEITDASTAVIVADLRRAQDLEDLSKLVKTPKLSLEATNKQVVTDVEAIFGKAKASDGPTIAVNVSPVPLRGTTVFTLSAELGGKINVQAWNPVNESGSLKLDRNQPVSDQFVALRISVDATEQPGRLFEVLKTGNMSPIRVTFSCANNSVSCMEELKRHWMQTLPKGHITYPIEGTRWAIATDVELTEEPNPKPNTMAVRYKLSSPPSVYAYRK